MKEERETRKGRRKVGGRRRKGKKGKKMMKQEGGRKLKLGGERKQKRPRGRCRMRNGQDGFRLAVFRKFGPKHSLLRQHIRLTSYKLLLMARHIKAFSIKPN